MKLNNLSSNIKMFLNIKNLIVWTKYLNKNG